MIEGLDHDGCSRKAIHVLLSLSFVPDQVVNNTLEYGNVVVLHLLFVD